MPCAETLIDGHSLSTGDVSRFHGTERTARSVNERQLREFPKRATPIILRSLKEALPEEKWCAPALSATAAVARDDSAGKLQPAPQEGAVPSPQSC